MSDQVRRILLEPIVFDVKSERILGLFKEIIRPEAINRNFQEGIDVRALVDHDASKIIGRLSAHTMRMAKMPDGVEAVIDVPEATYANDVVGSIDRGDIDGGSFSFQTLDDKWSEEDGETIREVLDLRFFEISVVTFPAYLDTDASFVQSSRDALFWKHVQQSHAVGGLHSGYYPSYQHREVSFVGESQRELAMLTYPDGRPVVRDVAEQRAREFRQAMRDRFGKVPMDTPRGLYWSSERGWFQDVEHRSESTDESSASPGLHSEDPRVRFRMRQLRQRHAMDELAADQERARKR